MMDLMSVMQPGESIIVEKDAATCIKYAGDMNVKIKTEKCLLTFNLSSKGVPLQTWGTKVTMLERNVDKTNSPGPK